MGKLDPACAYVIKAEELPLLSDLPANFPRPRRLEWINRGTDQRLRPTTVEMLLWTMFEGSSRSPSVHRLQHSTGLRVVFQSAEERSAFAQALRQSCTPKTSAN